MRIEQKKIENNMLFIFFILQISFMLHHTLIACKCNKCRKQKRFINFIYVSSCHSSECPNGTYGYGCFNCSEHCVNSSCDKFSENGVCLAGCEVGYTMENCNEGIIFVLLI